MKNGIALLQTDFNELNKINELVILSRRTLNYDEKYFNESTHLLKITKILLEENDGYSIKTKNNELVGFLGIEKDTNGDY